MQSRDQLTDKENREVGLIEEKIFLIGFTG